jgi:hypothetical protein
MVTREDVDVVPILRALVYDEWRIDRVNLDGRPMLRIKEGQRRIAYCADKRSALAVLARHGVPAGRLRPI